MKKRSKPMMYKILRLVVAGSKKHEFLNRHWISWLFKIVPRSFRETLALHLLSLSPHYFIYQWDSCYPANLKHREILYRENSRNIISRKAICNSILKDYLHSNDVVLDFGCGPGYLAREVSKYVSKVLATDVSAGTIACARELNLEDNIQYMTNSNLGLGKISDSSIDFIYSFAVFQHLEKKQTKVFLKEFTRILKPQGRALVHLIINDKISEEKANPNIKSYVKWYRARVRLRMVYYGYDEIKKLLMDSGFKEIRITKVEGSKVDDDVGKQHMAIFRK
ncbi:MAG: class I SAM-dependent methyltransferase [Candidatus Omnitrophota bacterium]